MLDDMDYTDFANGETRYKEWDVDKIKQHSAKLIDMLSEITN
jgi:hypothetical protein